MARLTKAQRALKRELLNSPEVRAAQATKQRRRGVTDGLVSMNPRCDYGSSNMDDQSLKLFLVQGKKWGYNGNTAKSIHSANRK